MDWNSPVLAVERWGNGPPTLLIHGLGASARYWHNLRDSSPRFAAVAPDLLGFGNSPKPSSGEYGVDDHLAGLAPLLPDGAVVVGHSAGAILAAALAAEHPDRIGGLVLVGLPAYPEVSTARREIGTLGLLARLTVEGRPVARLLCEAMCRLRPVAVAIAPRVQRDLPSEIAGDGARHTWLSYSRTLEHVVVEHRVGPDLHAARCPIRFVHGRDDTAAPIPYVRHLTKELRDAGRDVDLLEHPGDHHIAVRSPQSVGAAVSALHGPRSTR